MLWKKIVLLKETKLNVTYLSLRVLSKNIRHGCVPNQSFGGDKVHTLPFPASLFTPLGVMWFLHPFHFPLKLFVPCRCPASRSVASHLHLLSAHISYLSFSLSSLSLAPRRVLEAGLMQSNTVPTFPLCSFSDRCPGRTIGRRNIIYRPTRQQPR